MPNELQYGTPITGSLAQFLYINWLPEDSEQEYSKLFETCREPAKQALAKAENGAISKPGHRRATPHGLGIIEATCLNELNAM